MIVIVGDSWGVGEWASDTNSMHISGPGIGQILNYNFDVLNFSKGAGSNQLSLRILDRFLSKYQPTHYDPDISLVDRFYWIVTEPMRDIKIQDLVTASGIESHTAKVLKESFVQADQLAKKYNIKLNLIGGWCDLDPAWVSEHANLQVAVSSWGSLLHENYPRSIFGDQNLQEIGAALRSSNVNLVSEWLAIVDQVDAKIKTWNTKGWQAHHPNRHAHRVLRDYLYPEFSKYF
jgi:hypothetical protein